MLLLETIFDTLNAKAAIVAIEEVYDERRDDERLPLMISVTVTDLSGRTLSGQTIDAFWASIATRGRSASAPTARSARATCGRTSRTCAHRRLLRHLLPERRSAERVRSYDELPKDTAGSSTSSPPAVS